MVLNKWFPVLGIFFLLSVSCEKDKNAINKKGVRDADAAEEAPIELLLNDSGTSSYVHSDYHFLWNAVGEYGTDGPYEGMDAKLIRETTLKINGQSFFYYSKERTIYLEVDWDDSISIYNYTLQNPVWKAVTMQGITDKFNSGYGSDIKENFPAGYSITGTVSNVFRNRYPENNSEITEYVFLHKDDPSKLLYWQGSMTPVFLDRMTYNDSYINEMESSIQAQKAIEESTMSERAGVIFSVVFSPDGSQILYGSENGLIKLLETATGREIRSFIGQIHQIRSVAFSPDGSKILSGSEGGTIKLWDTMTGRDIRTFTSEARPFGKVYTAFTPGGRQILYGSFDIKLLDISTGRITRTIDSSGRDISISPDGRRIISSATHDRNRSIDHKVRLWDAETGTLIREFIGSWGSNGAAPVAFSPDGRYIGFGSGDDKTIIWETETGREVRAFSGEETVRAVAFSPDGRYIASSIGGYTSIIKLFDINTGQEINTFSGHSDIVESIAFSPDGRYLVSGSYDCTIIIWDVITGRAVRTIGKERPPNNHPH